MKTIISIVMAICFLGVAPAWAQDEETRDLVAFLEGAYQVIGQWPDSNQTYQGIVVIKNRGDHVDLLRTIDGRTVQAIGRISKATADKITVLSVTFARQDRTYEATYLINADLDNYARLTGYVYLQSGKTQAPGLEAMFSKR